MMRIESCYEQFVFTGSSALWKCQWVLYMHRWTHCPSRAEIEVCDSCFIWFWVICLCLCFTWDPLFTLALQFLYMLALCLILELVGGIVALIFRTQVQSFLALIFFLFFFVCCMMFLTNVLNSCLYNRFSMYLSFPSDGWAIKRNFNINRILNVLKVLFSHAMWQ